MCDVRSRMGQAIGTGEVISVRYHGGSRPGSIRELTPLAFVEPGKLRARCYTSGQVKVFVLSRIEPLAAPIPAGMPDMWSTVLPEPEIEPNNAAEICPDRRASFALLGWHVQEAEREGFFAIGLHRPKKVGGGYMKYSQVELSRTAWTTDLQVTADGGTEEVVTGPRARPWCLRTAGNGKSWKSYNKALAAFLAEAEKGPGAA